MSFTRILGLFVALSMAVASAIVAEGKTPYGDVFRGLTDAEAAALGRGDMVIRPLKPSGTLSLTREDDKAKEIERWIKTIHPNYTAEFMAIVPVKSTVQANDMLSRIAATLSDVEGYIHIPYWSKQQRTTYALFDMVDVVTREARKIGAGETIEVRQHMEPFDEFRMRYDYSVEAGSLRFSAVNLDYIVYSYQHFRAVAPGNMLWELYVFRQNDGLCVYGVGAVKAFDLFGVFRDRLESSLMGRVEAFFTYITKKIVAGEEKR